MRVFVAVSVTPLLCAAEDESEQCWFSGVGLADGFGKEFHQRPDCAAAGLQAGSFGVFSQLVVSLALFGQRALLFFLGYFLFGLFRRGRFQAFDALLEAVDFVE